MSESGNTIRLRAVGARLASRVVTNDDLASMFDTSHAWIVQRTGIHERRWVAPGETASSMATDAARVALARAGVEPADVGLVIAASSTPDYYWPGIAAQVQHALGIPPCAALNVNNVCNGFVAALAVARGMILGGQAGHVLVVASEVFSPLCGKSDATRATSVLFGDGAGAAVLSTGSGGPGPALAGVRIDGDGAWARILAVHGYGSAHGYTDPDGKGPLGTALGAIAMEGPAVFEHACRAMEGEVEHWRALLEREGHTVDRVVLHQANVRIADRIARRSAIPTERFASNIERVGNTSAASIPILLDELWTAGAPPPGSHWVLAAFGAGFSWGSALLRW